MAKNQVRIEVERREPFAGGMSFESVGPYERLAGKVYNAIADGQTLARDPDAREYLAANDSYHYFEKLDDLLITGPTNTNVMDVHVVLVGARA